MLGSKRLYKEFMQYHFFLNQTQKPQTGIFTKDKFKAKSPTNVGLYCAYQTLKTACIYYFSLRKDKLVKNEIREHIQTQVTD